jgi:hypothetical protein
MRGGLPLLGSVGLLADLPLHLRDEVGVHRVERLLFLPLGVLLLAVLDGGVDTCGESSPVPNRQRRPERHVDREPRRYFEHRRLAAAVDLESAKHRAVGPNGKVLEHTDCDHSLGEGGRQQEVVQRGGGPGRAVGGVAGHDGLESASRDEAGVVERARGDVEVRTHDDGGLGRLLPLRDGAEQGAVGVVQADVGLKVGGDDQAGLQILGRHTYC